MTGTPNTASASMPTMRPRRWLVDALDGAWTHPNTAHTAFVGQFQHTLGTFGYPFHVALAMLACFGIVGPVFLVELGALPLLVCWLARLPFVWRGVGVVFKQPVTLCLLAWWVWVMVSISWSPDPRGGWHEMRFTRWMWLAVALWPVLDRRGWLIAALCVGFACAHGAQFVEWFIVRGGGEVFSHPPAPDPLSRVSGWWHQPAAGGVMCAASLGLHTGPALLGRGWRRWAGLAGSAAAGAGLLMTGSRGSMIAAIAVCVVVAAVGMMRVLRSAGTAQSRAERVGGRRAVLVTALAAVLICAGAWAVLGRTVRSRVGIAQDELSRVVQRGDADSDIGARIIAARAAAWALRAAPLRGHGAGSFGTTTRAYVQEHGVAITEFRLQKLQTAHNTPLNALATTGLVGGVLLFAAWACALWGAGRGRIGAWDWVEDAGTYGASPLFALLALFFAAGFEVIYMNMTMQALFSVLVALSPVVRPLCLHSAGPTGACGPG